MVFADAYKVSTSIFNCLLRSPVVPLMPSASLRGTDRLPGHSLTNLIPRSGVTSKPPLMRLPPTYTNVDNHLLNPLDSAHNAQKLLQIVPYG